MVLSSAKVKNPNSLIGKNKGKVLNIEEIIAELNARFDISDEMVEEIRNVHKIYPAKINKYYLDLIQEVGDPIWKQCIPDKAEICDLIGEEDPLAEERDSPVELITHRYPDRVLFLISDECEMYCRFCTRKRKIGNPKLRITQQKLIQAIEYIQSNHKIRDVILSGGDALALSISRLEFVLNELRGIQHVEIIRIGTRVPCTNPSKITPELCQMLKKYHPLFINVHFEHPKEITPEAVEACNRLADAGIPLGNQNVLLKGVNDDPAVLADLYKKLLKMRVKPYYLYQADYVTGTNHFRTKVETGIDAIFKLRGHISGMAIPHFVIDAPNGGGKIPLLPDYVLIKDDEKVEMQNYQKKKYIYPQKQD